MLADIGNWAGYILGLILTFGYIAAFIFLFIAVSLSGNGDIGIVLIIPGLYPGLIIPALGVSLLYHFSECLGYIWPYYLLD